MPVIRKGAREEIAIEKIQQLFLEFADFWMDCKYITDTKEYILFNWEGEMAEYDRKKNKFTRIKYKNKPLEVGSILYENNKDYVVLYGFLGKCIPNLLFRHKNGLFSTFTIKLIDIIT